MNSGDRKKVFWFRLFVFTGLFLVPLAVDFSAYNPVYVKQVIFTGVVLGLFLSFAACRKVEIKLISMLPLLFVAWAAVCAFAGNYTGRGMEETAKLAVLSIFFLSVMNFGIFRFGEVRNIIIITSIPAAAAGLVQIFFPGAMSSFMVFGENIPGTFGNPNFFAAYIVAVIPVVLWRVLYGLGIRKVLNLALLAALVLCLVNTGSKAGLLVFILEAAYFAWFFVRQRGWGKRTVILMFSLIFAVSVLITVKIFDIPISRAADLEQWKKHESVFFRINVWQGAVKMAGDHPFAGVGPGAFAAAYPAYRSAELMKWASQHSYEVVYPENIFLQAAAETGFPGLLMLAFLVLFIIKHLKKEEREELDFYLGFLGVIAMNLFGVDLNYISSAMPAVFFAAIVTSDYPSKKFVLKGKGRMIFAAAGAALLAFIFVFQARHLASDVYLSRAVYFSKQAVWDEAISDYEKSLKANPENVAARYFLGSSWYDSKKDGHLAESLKHFEETEKRAPDYVLLHLKKGNVYADLGDIENAEKSFLRMIKLDPYLSAAYLGLARAYYRQQMYSEAERTVKGGLALMPDDPELLNGLGKVFIVSGRFGDAKEVLEKAIAIRERKDYYYNLGLTMLYLGEDNTAASYLEKAGALKDKNDPKLQMLINALRINLEGM